MMWELLGAAMPEIFYPPVMGTFCAGYALHLAWVALERRRARILLERFAAQIHWIDAALTLPSDHRGTE